VAIELKIEDFNSATSTQLRDTSKASALYCHDCFDLGDEPFRDVRLNARPLLRLQPPRYLASREACLSMKDAIGTLGRCISELDINRRWLTVLF
jgi:hypothetical protein